MFAVSNSSNMLGLVAPPQSGLGPAGPGLQRAQILGIPEANLLYKYVSLTSNLIALQPFNSRCWSSLSPSLQQAVRVQRHVPVHDQRHWINVRPLRRPWCRAVDSVHHAQWQPITVVLHGPGERPHSPPPLCHILLTVLCPPYYAGSRPVLELLSSTWPCCRHTRVAGAMA